MDHNSQEIVAEASASSATATWNILLSDKGYLWMK